jgi:hypothetical protein
MKYEELEQHTTSIASTQEVQNLCEACRLQLQDTNENILRA